MGVCGGEGVGLGVGVCMHYTCLCVAVCILSYWLPLSTHVSSMS